MAFQVAMPTSVVASHAWSRTLLREYWSSKCLASFGPEVVEQKVPEDVERLSPIGEAACVIAVEVRGVVFLFEHDLP
jgi:hypothetical protein